MWIRQAMVKDEEAMSRLLSQLGYHNTGSFIRSRIRELTGRADCGLFVYESGGGVQALLAMDTCPQLGFSKDCARINYLVVDENQRGKGIGTAMLRYALEWAGERQCIRLELHSSPHRQAAHRFYEGSGFRRHPEFFVYDI